jgi:hypothetical protein
MLQQQPRSRHDEISLEFVFMSTSNEQSGTRGLADLAACSASEALHREVVGLEVEDDEELELSPARRGHEKYFARIRLESFEDLQVLGLVPRRLKQQQVLDAIAEDDEQAFNLGSERMRKGQAAVAAPCNCHGDAHSAPTFAEELRDSVRHVRQSYNPALARVLSNHFGVEFRWDSMLAKSVRGWVRRYHPGIDIIAHLFEDITIGKNAKLVLTQASTSLLARAIRIHQTGKLVHSGGYLRIWANSIERFEDFPGVITWKHFIWALN